MRIPKIIFWICLLAFLLALSSCTKKPIPLTRPNGVAVLPDGTLTVMDFGNYRLVHLRENGEIIRSFGAFGTRPDQIYYGWDLAADSTGNLYFGNIIRNDEGTLHDGVKAFSLNGSFIQELGAGDYDPTSSTDYPNMPYSLEIDDQNLLYVADYYTCQVRMFASSGELLDTFFGCEDEVGLVGPNDVGIDDQRGLMYITDFDRHVVEQFRMEKDASGTLSLTHLQTMGHYGRDNGEFAFPQNMTVNDETGYVYVGDLGNRRIQVFDSEGNYVTSFRPSGVADWQVMGLAVGASGDIYAADALNNVIWKFTHDGKECRRVEVTQ